MAVIGSESVVVEVFGALKSHEFPIGKIVVRLATVIDRMSFRIVKPGVRVYEDGMNYPGIWM